MTAPSPNSIPSGQVTFSIKSDGKAIPDTVGVVSIDVFSTVNKVPKARLEIYDGDAASQEFPVTDSDTFVPGKKLQIAAGYSGGSDKVIFDGVVIKAGLSITGATAPRLVVEAADPALAMTLERRNGVFEKIKDSDLIGKLISRNGLAKSVKATTTTYEELVQYYATDWDMMLTRAEANGMVAITKSGRIEVAPPDTSASPVLTLSFGEAILDMNLDLDAPTQFAASAIKSFSWDPAQQKLVNAGPGSVKVTEPGNLSSAELAKVFNVKNVPQQTGSTQEVSSLKAWSEAELQRSKLSKVRGSVRFQGSALAETGKTVTLAGVSKRFDGTAYVSGVHHVIRDGRWTTEVKLGLSAENFAEETPDIEAPQASGLLPGIQGLQTGVVKSTGKDPGGEYRVEIKLPILQDDANTVWARLGGYYASNKVGEVFYPEVNDEVVVGFMNADPSAPVILGSLYSSKLPPPYIPDAKNDIKAIVTRSKLEMTFDDKNKIVEIKTPGGHSVTLDDKTGKLSLKDSNKNSVVLSKSGIQIDSASNISLKAKANITIDAGANLSMKAKAAASLEGLSVNAKAKTQFSAQGSASAEVKSSGILTIRGTLVKIN